MFPACLARISVGTRYCTGTLMRPDTVVTCAHFFRGVQGKVTVEAGGRKRFVRDVHVVPGTDIAVVQVRRFRHADAFPALANPGTPAPGTPTVTFGFGGRAEHVRARAGRWLTPLPFAFSRTGSVVRPAGLVFSPAIKGDSGGPVLIDGHLTATQSLILDPFGRSLRIATVNLIPDAVRELVTSG